MRRFTTVKKHLNFSFFQEQDLDGLELRIILFLFNQATDKA